MFKTATDGTFGGRRVKLGMTVVVVVPGPSLFGGRDLMEAICTHASCYGFDGDEPLWLVAKTDKPRKLRFVASEDDLDIDTWTWPERV